MLLCLFVLNIVQVEALADGVVVDGPVVVSINVLDVNNNAPYFNQSSYLTTVREKSLSGKHLKVFLNNRRNKCAKKSTGSTTNKMMSHILHQRQQSIC